MPAIAVLYLARQGASRFSNTWDSRGVRSAPPSGAEQEANTGNHRQRRVRPALQGIVNRLAEGVGYIAECVDGLAAARGRVGNHRIRRRLGAPGLLSHLSHSAVLRLADQFSHL